MLNALLVVCLIGADPNFDNRLDVLGDHLQRLRAIDVTREHQRRADAMIDELAARIATRPDTSEEIDGLYRSMDEVRTWLLRHAENRPTAEVGEFFEDGSSWGVRNDNLTLTILEEDLSITVKTRETTWTFRPSDDSDVTLRSGGSFPLISAKTKRAAAFHTGYSAGMRLSLEEFAPAPRARIDLLAHLIGSEIVFEIVAVEDVANLDTIAFPKSIETGNAETDVAVIPRMQGMLIPGNWRQDIHYRNLANSRELYMPWWGQIADGHGVQVILETAVDAGAEYNHPPGGPTVIQPLWYSSLNRLRYPRRARYVFDDASTYVKMAKRYRRYVQEHGRFVSLAEKRVRTPDLDKVIGKPVIHIGALYHSVEGSRFFKDERMERNHRLRTFKELADGLRELHGRGIKSAYVHLDGWGYYGYDNGHPDVLPPGPQQGGWQGLRVFANTCEELDYLFAVHDQYRDFYFSAPSFDKRLGVLDFDGTRTVHAEWAGGKQTFLSARFAPGYVRRNHDLFAEHGVKVRGAYLDVFAVNPPEESYAPSHPVTRSDCARYRRECFDLLRARGYVVSSEEPADYLVRSLDLVHHGPYPTLPKGYGRGKGTGIAVPLFNLVYHDSILLPWHLTEDGGWGIPDGDAGWLHCVLNTGLPYVSLGAEGKQIRRVREVCNLARRLGTLEMTNHEFLDRSRRRQRTTFSDGTRITVDFEKKTYEVSEQKRNR